MRIDGPEYKFLGWEWLREARMEVVTDEILKRIEEMEVWSSDKQVYAVNMLKLCQALRVAVNHLRFYETDDDDALTEIAKILNGENKE